MDNDNTFFTPPNEPTTHESLQVDFESMNDAWNDFVNHLNTITK